MATRRRKAPTTTVSPASPERSHDRAPAERWQHGDHDDYAQDEARPALRVQRTRTAADTLLARGDIGPEQWSAAQRYRSDYERGLSCGASLPLDAVRVSGGGGNGVAGYNDRRVEAVHAVRQADQALGDEGKALMQIFLIMGLSYLQAEAALAQEPDGPLGSPLRRVLKSRFVETLGRLARHYSGALYRPARPRLEPEVSEAVAARRAGPRKPMDLELMSMAIHSRIADYAAIGATSDAVAALLNAEFGMWAEVILEAEDA